MRCVNCGHTNAPSSVYCQQCGLPLAGAARPQVVPGPTPPIGAPPITSPAPAPAGSKPPTSAPPQVKCSRCGAFNPGHMRFCTECGNEVKLIASIPADSAEVRMQNRGGPLCWRCRGIGDPNAMFCKFCGAKYADAPDIAGAVEHEAPMQQIVLHHAPPPLDGPKTDAPPQPVRKTEAAGMPAMQGRASLVSILKDGSDGRAFALTAENTDIGRLEGDVVLGDDPYLSPRHARVQRRGDAFVLRDLDSVNGVYVRLIDAVEILDGDLLLLGQQVLRFEMLSDGELPLGPATLRGVFAFGTPEVPRIARLVQYTTEGVGRDVHYLYRDETVLGRENGDIVFTDDPFLSRRHAAIAIDRAARKFMLRDLGSSNGTALRIRKEHALRHADQFRIGRHLFRFDMTGGARA